MLTLAKTKSFSEAARELDISQPSLSQYIKKLEEQLKVKLVDYSSGEVSLTDAGQVYVEIGSRMLDLQHSMENQISDISNYKSGSIRIGISPYRCIHMMPEIVRKFKQYFPGIHLILDEYVGSELLDAASKGAFDLFVTTLPIDEKIYNYEHLIFEEMVVVIPKQLPQHDFILQNAIQNPRRNYSLIDLKLLNHLDFVFLGEKQVMQIRLNDLCDRFGIQLKKAVECVSIEAQLALVEKGIGAALVPSSVIDKSKNNSFSIFSLEQTDSSREIVVCYRKGQYLTTPIVKLIEIMKNLEK